MILILVCRSCTSIITKAAVYAAYTPVAVRADLSSMSFCLFVIMKPHGRVLQLQTENLVRLIKTWFSPTPKNVIHAPAISRNYRLSFQMAEMHV